MLSRSIGLKIVVNPDDTKVRGEEDGEMHGHTVKSYWENHAGLIVNCKDTVNEEIKFHATGFNIRRNKSNNK